MYNYCNQLRNKLLPYFASASLLCATTGVTFSDSVDVLFQSPYYTLDASQYVNTVMGVQSGSWMVDSFQETTISNFKVTHSIFLLGQGTLNTVRVYGSTSSTVNLIANQNTPQEQSYSGSTGTLTNEFVFNLSGYDMAQGGETLFTGFDTITKITFSGEYMQIPEPSASYVLLLPAAGLALGRSLRRRKRCSL